jgi:hypothetical protein
MESPRAFYFNEDSQISYFWSPREKFLPSTYKTCLLLPLTRPKFKIGFHSGHAVADTGVISK